MRTRAAKVTDADAAAAGLRGVGGQHFARRAEHLNSDGSSEPGADAGDHQAVGSTSSLRGCRTRTSVTSAMTTPSSDANVVMSGAHRFIVLSAFGRCRWQARQRGRRLGVGLARSAKHRWAAQPGAADASLAPQPGRAEPGDRPTHFCAPTRGGMGHPPADVHIADTGWMSRCVERRGLGVDGVGTVSRRHEQPSVRPPVRRSDGRCGLGAR